MPFSASIRDREDQGDTARTTKEPEPPKPIRWNVYKISSKAVWLGEIEALDETAAMAAAEFKVPTKRLMTVR